MKKILFIIIALFVAVFSLHAANLNQTVRVQIITNKTYASAHVSLPVYGDISTNTGNNYVEGKPLFVTENNGAILMCTIQCSGQHTVVISNGAGYAKTITVSSSASINEEIPLNDSGYTIITIQIVS